MNIIMFLSVLWWMLLTIIPSCSSQASSMNMSTCMPCSHIEREALVKFKHSLVDPSNRLHSWAGDDCCNWAGIRCDNRTGHVILLDIGNPHPFNLTRSDENHYDPIYSKSCLVGQEVNPSLLDLKHLKHLDLSWNNFSGIPIPDFFGSFSDLRYLNLSFSFFGGVVPHHLGNLSTLRFLDLNMFPYDGLNDVAQLRVDNLQWVSGLSHLKHLDMSFVNLSRASNPMQSINSIPHLLELHLHDCGISENLQLSISNFNLTSMIFLNLAQNDFHDPLPNFIKNMTSLRVLDFFENRFNDTIHNDLSHLCNLETLNFRSNNFSGEVHKLFENSSSSKCFKNSKLVELSLSNNQLSGHVPDWLGQLKNLRVLGLSRNSFVGPLPPSLWKLSSLRYLYLGENKFNGSILESLKQLSHLEGLWLPSNSFFGPLPTSLWKLSSLKYLHLGNNKFNGSIPESLGQLSHLEGLSLNSNSFEGVLSDIHFANLSNLKYLILHSNSLILKPRSNWIPPFQLDRIKLGSCKMGLEFPSWLKTQNVFNHLDISHAGIKDTVPGWFFNLSSNKLESTLTIYLSYNQLYGRVPKIFTPRNVDKFYLYSDHNNFEGSLPRLPSSATHIDFSDNLFSGPIHDIGVTFPNLQALVLSNNFFTGLTPHSLCEMKSLSVLDLSMNHLSGHLPQCLGNLQQLAVLDLSSNNIPGTIPSSISELVQLKSLHLSKNKFHGQIPLSLKNCTSLITLDLGENKLSGSVPIWIGEYLSSLAILRLRQNKMSGIIPLQLCRLTSLQILDLAHNNISGTIPRCFSKLSGMVLNQSIGNWSSDYVLYTDNINTIVKGRENEYTNTLPLVTGLDLSNNNLVGMIPEELMILSALRSLNLSKNEYEGIIPEQIGELASLESLDLSENQLSGRIPESISGLTFLSHLNLSHNKLSGKIPSGNQLQTLDDPSIYDGNPMLCGAPLNKCPEAHIDINAKLERTKKDDAQMAWFYIGMACGHVVGFLGVCGVLFFKRPWRVAYFHFLNDLKNWLSVKIAMNVARLKRRLERNQFDG